MSTADPPAPLPRLLGLVLRPTAPPLGLGIVVAAVFIIAETVLVSQLREVASENSFGALFLLGVLVVSAGWRMRLAVVTSLVSAVVYVHFHMETHGALLPVRPQDMVAIAIFLPVALLTNVLVGQARVRAAEAGALAEQQAALRRVATLVANGSHPVEVYPAAVNELASGLGMDHVALLSYSDGEPPLVLASRDPAGSPKLPVGEHLPLDGESLAATVWVTGLPSRIEDYNDIDGGTAAQVRAIGIRSAVAAPVIVGGQVRAVLVVGSVQPHTFAPDTEARVADFADLVATAIRNAETHAELTASRARIVTAADQARRRFERDLHDGAQQRVVSLGLAVRAVEASVPADQPALRSDIAKLATDLSALSTELQELSRGIHPAILSKGGLAPALRALARRSAVPVELHLDLTAQLPESVEVAAYYVVAEALTNAAKHAHASVVDINATADDGELQLTIRDDGIGGATAAGTTGGSGLIGLKDRVEALAGHLTITSAPGAGTTLVARMPLECG
ncbi:DUF4118 domain-containing protein [Mycobacterium sp. 21AC1]|uniref:GAF domain-containing sensor histidine kinase n=1 Tax=[Mycobacterium] appelbergii TaxID=2939269 RepID=UPI0029394D45|nr:GAF domain-containing protein [Mycobacterium sp. 21AC1]MDV3125531.1 DUF4118 domain-containing protein [Mycobacterium sp. 21AC1]